ncbi:helix-turn-helix domain-containing protein [uncultured Megasphaera sp.]|uniref:helix-turn-helix domain-containing protein n=1 Tax=uncultured Megasphaera sp. TaxID=165188 RepID=UPI0025E6B001|nr:helix-turn-helix transcriptional regulator [uncultured Megasphaera sp.]
MCNTVLCQNLLRLRKKAGMSRADVADRLSVTPTAYAAYELGKSEPKIGRLCEIAKILNVSPNDLLLEEDSHPKKFNPRPGQSFFSLTPSGDVCAYIYLTASIEGLINVAIGNCFPSSDAAKNAAPDIMPKIKELIDTANKIGGLKK